MQENNNFSKNNSIKNVFIVVNPTPTSKPKHSYFCTVKEKHDRQINAITIIYLLQKFQKHYQK